MLALAPLCICTVSEFEFTYLCFEYLQMSVHDFKYWNETNNFFFLWVEKKKELIKKWFETDIRSYENKSEKLKKKC